MIDSSSLLFLIVVILIAVTFEIAIVARSDT